MPKVNRRLHESGQFRLNAKLLDVPTHPFEENRPFTKYEAWLDLLLQLSSPEGRVSGSYSALGKRWEWTVSLVRRFLQRKQEQGLLEHGASTTGRKRIEIQILDFEVTSDVPPVEEPEEEPVDPLIEAANRIINLHNKGEMVKPAKSPAAVSNAVTAIKARLKDGYSEDDLVEHWHQWHSRCMAHQLWEKAFKEELRFDNPLWCPSYKWLPHELYSPMRLAKYFDKWKGDSLPRTKSKVLKLVEDERVERIRRDVYGGKL